MRPLDNLNSGLQAFKISTQVRLVFSEKRSYKAQSLSHRSFDRVLMTYLTLYTLKRCYTLVILRLGMRYWVPLIT